MSDSPRGRQGGVYQEEKLELKEQEQPKEQQQTLGTYFVRNYSKRCVRIKCVELTHNPHNSSMK